MRALLALALIAGCTTAAAAPLIIDGEVPQDGDLYLHVPFEVPAGTVEIELRHDDLSAENILDFGVFDPQRFRGWGGGNTEPAIIGERAASRSYLAGPLPAGTWQVVIGKAKIVSPPARYHLEIELRTTATLPPQTERTPYVATGALKSEARWYAGDLHVHSKESGDARPPLDEVATFARGRGLDFVVVTDHNTVSHLDFIVDAQTRHPELLLVPGVEFTTYSGHANGIGSTAFVDFRLGHDGWTIDRATQAFTDQGAVFSINHPVLDLGEACIGCAWEHAFDRGRLGAVEIQTGAWSVSGAIFGDRPLKYWDALCAKGLRIAAVGGSDDHRAGVDLSSLHSPIGSPTTLVYADALSERAIVEGIRRGRTVVKLEGPGDPMIDLVAGGARPGDTVRGDAVIDLTVTGGTGHQLRLVQDGAPQPPVVISKDPFVHRVEVAAPTAGEQRLRAEVLVDGKVRTVTSHLWIAPAPPAPPPAAGCGCATSAFGSFGLALLAALFWVRRRRWV